MPDITPQAQKDVEDFIKKNDGLFSSLGKDDYQDTAQLILLKR